MESKNYKIVHGTMQGSGTYYILDKKTDKSTLRFVCSEGQEYLKKLKRLYRKSRKLFDAECSIHEYTDG